MGNDADKISEMFLFISQPKECLFVFDNFRGNVDVQFVNLSDTWERINYLLQDLPQNGCSAIFPPEERELFHW